MYKKIVILGYSGHSYSIIDALSSVGDKVEFYCEKKESKKNPFQLQFIGDETELNLNKYKDYYFFPAIGDNKIRKELTKFIEENGLHKIKIIHSSAKISNYSSIDDLSFVGNGAIINAMCSIGKGVIINSGSIIEHECKIHDFAHIAPGAVLLGNVEVGYCSLVGANCTVKAGVKIGKSCIIGAGSVILKDVPDNTTMVGNPSRILKKNE